METISISMTGLKEERTTNATVMLNSCATTEWYNMIVTARKPLCSFEIKLGRSTGSSLFSLKRDETPTFVDFSMMLI
jgi:hypothetical protein